VIISSRTNPTVKHIRSLRERKERDREGRAFVEGIRLVVEAAQLGAEIETLVVAPELLKSEVARQVVEQQRLKGTPVLEVSPDVFGALSQKEGPQGIGAVVRERVQTLDDLQSTGPYWVALDEPQDPGNIGTILRTADATGCAGMILLGHSADPYDPSALRASMGAVFCVPLVKTGFAELVAWKRARGVMMVGTSDRGAVGYHQAAYQFPLVLLMGSEREGLSAEQMQACDLMARIPMAGRSDSLNLAVATGVMLYELYARQHTGE
jgi:TrmH family RNA methyltransferase